MIPSSDWAETKFECLYMTISKHLSFAKVARIQTIIAIVASTWSNSKSSERWGNISSREPISAEMKSVQWEKSIWKCTYYAYCFRQEMESSRFVAIDILEPWYAECRYSISKVNTKQKSIRATILPKSFYFWWEIFLFCVKKISIRKTSYFFKKLIVLNQIKIWWQNHFISNATGKKPISIRRKSCAHPLRYLQVAAPINTPRTSAQYFCLIKEYCVWSNPDPDPESKW